jgi:hypothetical protein
MLMLTFRMLPVGYLSAFIAFGSTIQLCAPSVALNRRSAQHRTIAYTTRLTF